MESTLNINWGNDLCTIKSLLLGHWLHSVTSFLLEFPHLSLIHIFQKSNYSTDALSMRGLSSLEGSIFLDYWIGDTPLREDCMALY